MKNGQKPKRALALLIALIMIISSMPAALVSAAPGPDANYILRFPVPAVSPTNDGNHDSYQHMSMLTAGEVYTATISVRTAAEFAGQIEILMAYGWGNANASQWLVVEDDWQTLEFTFTRTDNTWGSPFRIHTRPDRNTNTEDAYFDIAYIIVTDSGDNVAFETGPDFIWGNNGSANAERVPFGFHYNPGLGDSIYALRVQVPETGAVGDTYDNLAGLTVGGQYTIFASVITTPEFAGTVDARIAYNWGGGAQTPWTPVTDQWQILQQTFTFAGDWSPLRVTGRRNPTYNTAGYFYVAQIIIINSDDEIVWATGPNFNWYNGGGAQAEVVVFGAGGPSGNYALRVDAEFDAAVWFMDGHYIPEGTYRMSAWVRGNATTIASLPYGHWGNWNYHMLFGTEYASTMEWTFVESETVDVAGAVRRFMLWSPTINGEPNADATIFLANFVLERLVDDEWEVFLNFVTTPHYRVADVGGPYVAPWLFDNVRRVPLAEANEWEGPEEPPVPVDPIVDRLGQIVAAAGNFDTWVDPDSTYDDLRAILADDEEWLTQFNRPTEWDMWGGLEGSGVDFGFEATGFFRVENYTWPDGRVQSFMINPLGNIYFNNAPNVIDNFETYTNIAGRHEVYEWLPLEGDERTRFNAAFRGGNANFSFFVSNWIRTRDIPFNNANFAAAQSDRLWNLGFTGAGHWSLGIPHPQSAGLAEPFFPEFGQLRLPGNLGGGQGQFLIGNSHLWDVFHTNFRTQMYTNFRNDTARLGSANNANNQRIIGFFMENERFYDHLRFEILGGGGAGSGTRNRLMVFLQERYGTIEELNAAWNINLANFNAFNTGSIPINTHATSTDMDDFYFIYFTELFRATREVFDEVLPNHMLLGDRWHSRIMANSTLANILVEASAPYLDAMSFNYYAWDVDTDMIARLFELGGQTPFIMTEFHYGDRSTGLTFGVRAATSEAEKGSMYRNYVEAMAYSGHVVGVNWFTWLDQAPTGRYFEGHGGEAGALGFFNVMDRPYRTFLEYVTTTNFEIYDLVLRNRSPHRHTFLPGQVERDGDQHLQIPHIVGGFDIYDLSSPWVGAASITLDPNSIVVGVLTQEVAADFYLGWYNGYMYLRADITDPTPMNNPAAITQDFGYVWGGDAVELFFGPENVDQGGGMQFGDIQALFGANYNNGNPVTINSWYNRGSRLRPPLSPNAGDSSRLLLDIGTLMGPGSNRYTLATRIPMEEVTGRVLADGEIIKFDMGISAAILPHGGRSHQLMWNGTIFNSSSRERWGTIEFVYVLGHTVYFYDGDYQIASVRVDTGETVTPPADPVRDGYNFDGWFTADDVLWNFDTPIDRNVTLFAGWTQLSDCDDCDDACCIECDFHYENCEVEGCPCPHCQHLAWLAEIEEAEAAHQEYLAWLAEIAEAEAAHQAYLAWLEEIRLAEIAYQEWRQWLCDTGQCGGCDRCD